LAAVKSNDGEVFQADIIINNEEVPARRSFGLVSEQKRIIAELKKEVQQVSRFRMKLLVSHPNWIETS
jgi:hypothetical protein